jgi:hypothetical protein
MRSTACARDGAPRFERLSAFRFRGEALPAWSPSADATDSLPTILYPWVRVPAGLVVFALIGHSQARAGSRLNHVNILVIDNSVRFDIVPKI